MSYYDHGEPYDSELTEEQRADAFAEVHPACEFCGKPGCISDEECVDHGNCDLRYLVKDGDFFLHGACVALWHAEADEMAARVLRQVGEDVARDIERAAAILVGRAGL